MRIAILGPLRVTGTDGRAIDVGGTRLRTLLVRLALEPGRVVGTPALIAAVWDDDPPSGATNALQTLVSRLRRALPGLVHASPTGYRLDLRPEQVDAYEFERLAMDGRRALSTGDPRAAAERLAEALALWRGPALADASEAGFARAPAARLSEARVAATEDAIQARLSIGTDDSVIAESAELAAAYPTRERTHALLIRALRDAGRQAEALRAYQRLRATLAEELGVAPSPEISALHLSVLRGSGSGNGAGRGNLRAPLTSFVGREADLDEVTRSLHVARLVTLVGTGGAGKTRLATEVARRAAGGYPDGVWLVELAPLREPDEMTAVLAETLQLRFAPYREPGRGLRGRLLDALADKQMLLVLDNCEHLVDECARLAETILGECPQVRILATSREPLAITGERLYPVAPLPTPPRGTAVTPPEAREPVAALAYPAVRLFAERAAAVRPGFAVTDSTVDDVVEICRRLDGLPLAIELSTARLRTLPLEQIAGRLGDRFRLLTGGSRTALPRHQTLQAVVDWSWELLDEDERRLARRFSVFLDGSTVDAVEAVCAADPATLGGLVDKSFITLVDDRYRMLETIRAYAAERLAASGEAERVRAAHAAWYLDLAEQAEPQLRGAGQLSWLGRLSAEWDNLRAALRGAIDSGDAPTAVRLAAALGWFWVLRSAHTEASGWLSQALALPGEVPPDVRGLARLHHGLNLIATGDMAGGSSALGEGTDLPRQAGAIGAPLLAIAAPVAAVMVDDATRAWSLLPAALAYPDPWAHAVALVLRASLYFRSGDLRRAEEDLATATAAFREIGDRWGIGMALATLSEAHSLRGDNAGAIALLEESLELSNELGVDDDMAQVLFEISRLRARDGDFDGAEAALRRAGVHAHRSGMSTWSYILHLGSAEVYRHRGDLEAAVREYRLALDELSSIRGLPPGWRSVAEAGLAIASAGLGDLSTARESVAGIADVAVAQHNGVALASVTEVLAAVALAEREPARAAHLLGLAEALRGVPDLGSPDAAAAVRAARAALGDEEYGARYAAAAGLGQEAATAAMRGYLAGDRPTERSVRPSAGTG